MKDVMSDKQQELLMEWAWAALTLVVGIIITIIIVKLTRKALKKTRLEPILQSFIVSATRVLCLIMVAIITLEKVGVNPSSFITVMGVTGAAVALAVKDTLSNIAGGLMIIATHPFRQGDLVEIDDKLGFVEATTLVRTSLRTYDNRVIEVPNNLMSNAILINYSPGHCQWNLHRYGLGSALFPGSNCNHWPLASHGSLCPPGCYDVRHGGILIRLYHGSDGGFPLYHKLSHVFPTDVLRGDL